MEELIEQICNADRRNEVFAELISVHALNEQYQREEEVA